MGIGERYEDADRPAVEAARPGGSIRPQGPEVRIHARPREGAGLGTAEVRSGDPSRERRRGLLGGTRERRGDEGPGRDREQAQPHCPDASLCAPGEVAQLVEHTTENRGVASSILALAIARECGKRRLPGAFFRRWATDWATPPITMRD